MVFWIAILTGALFIWLAVRMGFYETWVLLFNICVSVYVSIFLAPLIAQSVPMPGGAAWCIALSMLALAGGCFAILHGLSWVFLTGQFSIRFPSVFDVVLSGILGFVAGFLILSFAALTVSTTPLMEHKIVSTLGLGREGQKANVAGLARCCDLIHSMAGFGDGSTTQTAVERLLKTTDTLSENDKATIEPNEPNAANTPQTKVSEKKDTERPSLLRKRTIPTDSMGE